jgi:dolichol-phosphate hexosyltransferase
MTDFSILMPVYNEVTTVETAIARTLKADYPVENVEIVVVDDGSTDGSYELLQRGGLPDQVTLLRHPQNQGKGAAIVTALAHAKGEYVGILDADLEYDPQDLALLLRPLLDGEADAVFGTRGFQSHSSYGFWYVLGNRGVTLVANVLYNSWISDIMTCHKVMSARSCAGCICASGASRSSPKSPRACCARALESMRCRSRTGRVPARRARSSWRSTGCESYAP